MPDATPPAMPGPTGPLPKGLHRLCWVQDGKARYVVSTEPGDVITLYSTLTVLRDADPWAHISMVSEVEHYFVPVPGFTP